MKQQTALHSSTAYNSSLQSGANINSMSKPSETKLSKPPTAVVQKGKGKAPPSKAPLVEDEDAQPSQLVQAQMAARAKAHIRAAKHATEPTVQSESIELPDINSEYSDSEDEDRAKTFDPPHWAQSPELRHALQVQSTINPDEIFGSVKPLRMEELFKTRTSRFRARTSSANWTGSDRLTREEERDYARRMGFK
jgi:Inner centromere protein, ARK binding region